MLLVATHPVQYAAPVFKLLADDPRVQIQVAYCSMQGADAEVDAEFGVRVKWDIPLLDGYPWILLPNRSGKPKLGSFFGLFNPGIWHLISRGRFDAVVFYTGYRYSTFWIGLGAAKWRRVRVLFGTDAYSLFPRDVQGWKTHVKKWLWPHLFALADMVIVPSSGSVDLMRSLDVPEGKIALTPYCVDNAWWIQQSDRVNRAQVRARWNIPEDSVVILFCAKLQEWKRPQDLLRAFGALRDRRAFLVFAGDGPLKSALEEEAVSLGVVERLRFLGFANQSELPEIYRASDILVLPSAYEPFGVVVNEAMLCGCSVIVSDRVGARFDLVRDGKIGFVFPARDVSALARLLDSLLQNPERLREMGIKSRERMAEWSPRDNIAGLIEGAARAIASYHADKAC